MHDQAIIERRIERLDIAGRSARPGEREAGEREQHLLQQCLLRLEGGQPLRNHINDPDDLKTLANYAPLSLKPMLVLLNIDEADATDASKLEVDFTERYGAECTSAVAMCAKLEAELADLSPGDAEEFRRELEGGDTPANRVLRRIQELLRLVTFYTPVGDECKAWTVPAGSTVVQAAGRIHTDMERGFIRAEVINVDRLLERGSFAEAKKHGQLRTEGKQYVVQDGDVIHVLFNV